MLFRLRNELPCRAGSTLIHHHLSHTHMHTHTQCSDVYLQYFPVIVLRQRQAFCSTTAANWHFSFLTETIKHSGWIIRLLLDLQLYGCETLKQTMKLSGVHLILCATEPQLHAENIPFLYSDLLNMIDLFMHASFQLHIALPQIRIGKWSMSLADRQGHLDIMKLTWLKAHNDGRWW